MHILDGRALLTLLRQLAYPLHGGRGKMLLRFLLGERQAVAADGDVTQEKLIAAVKARLG